MARSIWKNSEKSKQNPKISLLDITAKKLISTIDSSYSERQLLSSKDAKIQSIINGELDLAKGISGGSIVDFAASMAKDNARRNGRDPNEVDTTTMFTEDIGNLFGYYQELYKNRYVELTDLKFITKFIPAIGEAVNITLDAIVSSDDYSTSIARTIELNTALTEDEKTSVLAEIARIEREEKLLKKLKNVVYRSTLVSGNHYIYCIPYAELFEEYSRLVKNNKISDQRVINSSIAKGIKANTSKFNQFKSKNGTESKYKVSFESYCPESKEIVMEAIDNFKSTLDKSSPKDAVSRFESTIASAFENISIVDTECLVEALEGFSAKELMEQNLKSYSNTFGGIGILDEKNATTDATADITDREVKGDKFNTRGSYIKYIEATKLVPVDIHNETIGYLYARNVSAAKAAKNMMVHPTTNTTNMLTSGSNVFSSVNITTDKKNNAVNAIVDAITDGIIANFSNKFVNKNADFKKMIADCIIANGMINTDYQIQFIPAKYIIPFTINENENGIGQSMLQDSLFPAKMLLSLIVSKLLLFMNKSGNKTLAFVRKGPIEVGGSNHIQRVIRMMQEQNITFSDLLSTNLSFAKFSRNGNMQIPVAQNGDRLIDFEIQEGQQIDLDTPMEQFLEKLAILGTGVPSVIMEYTDVADYAKSIVTANMKQAGRVATFQSDLEEATTDLYIKLLQTSQLPKDIIDRAITGFAFKLCRPRVLANSNMSDYLSQVEQITRMLSNMYMGENDENPEDTKIRSIYMREVSKTLLPFVPWSDFDKIYEEAKITAIKGIKLDNNQSDSENTAEEFDDTNF